MKIYPFCHGLAQIELLFFHLACKEADGYL